jgi:hypothetical protein
MLDGELNKCKRSVQEHSPVQSHGVEAHSSEDSSLSRLAPEGRRDYRGVY